MINPIPTWREGRLVLVRLKDSSVIVLMNQTPKTATDRLPLQTKSDIKTGKNEIIFKPRDQIEVRFSTSNYNGYVTECRGSLSNQNFIGLIQIISVFCNIYLLACPLS